MTPPQHRHILLSSNRWFSAATEYGLRLSEYLAGAAPHGVTVVAHGGSPLLARARGLGLAVAEVPLRGAGGRSLRPWEWPRLVVALARMLGDLAASGQGNGGVVWVVEGTEHTLVALLLALRPRWRRRLRLVRLRVQDRVKPAGVLQGFAERLQARRTDLIVFPSQVARQRYFDVRPQGRVAYGDRVFVQLFCKDAASASASVSASGSAEPGLWSLVEDNPETVVLLSVARFDHVKGLGDLIDAFAALELEPAAWKGRPLALVICGRTEALTGEDLCRRAAEKLGGTAEAQALGGGFGLYVARAQARLRQVIVVDGHVAQLDRLLRRAALAVIASTSSEIVCRTAVEALQAGLPVVATRVGSLPEVLGDVDAGDGEGCAWMVGQQGHQGQYEGGGDRVRELQVGLVRALTVLGPDLQSQQRAPWAERCRRRGARYLLRGYGPLLQRVSASLDNDGI